MQKKRFLNNQQQNIILSWKVLTNNWIGLAYLTFYHSSPAAVHPTPPCTPPHLRPSKQESNKNVQYFTKSPPIQPPSQSFLWAFTYSYLLLYTLCPKKAITCQIFHSPLILSLYLYLKFLLLYYFNIFHFWKSLQKFQHVTFTSRLSIAHSFQSRLEFSF